MPAPKTEVTPPPAVSSEVPLEGLTTAVGDNQEIPLENLEDVAGGAAKKDTCYVHDLCTLKIG